MQEITNQFGKGIHHDVMDIEYPIFILCCACTSVLSDLLSWANKYPERTTTKYLESKSIIIAGCQVTDLAILNDLQTLEEVSKYIYTTKLYVAGCLAFRFDIPLPANVERLAPVRADDTPIKDTSLINWQPPFWTRSGAENKLDGTLFRDCHPLRISVGCKKKCTYCTIRSTRGPSMEHYPFDLDIYQEFQNNENILLVADSPSQELLEHWITASEYNHKPISIRNVEPTVLVQIKDWIRLLSKKKLLKALHCPVQSLNIDILKDMGRNPEVTLESLNFMKEIKTEFPEITIATNVIIDYKNFDYDPLKDERLKFFDLVNWNPFWNGKWDRNKAEERWKKYLG